MDPPQSFQPFLRILFNQGDPAYIGMERESDDESEEDHKHNTSPLPLLIRALSLNAWLLGTIVFLILFMGKSVRFRCDNSTNIWAMSNSGLCV